MYEGTSPVEISVLGPLMVRVDGVERVISAPKQRSLLARLVVADGQSVSRAELLDALWGERPPQTASKNLHVLVGRLRGILGAPVIRATTSGYRLDASACRVDAHAFDRAACRVAEEGETCDARDVLELATDALTSWRGPLAREFREPWAQAFAARLDARRRAVASQALRLRVVLEPNDDLVAELRSMVAADPHDELLRVLLTDALVRVGDELAAREALVAAIDELGEGVGLELDPRLRDLSARLGVAGGSTHHDPGVDASVDRLLDSAGTAFSVTELLELAASSNVDPAVMLDALEARVASGEYARAQLDDGRVVVSVRRATTGD